MSHTRLFWCVLSMLAYASVVAAQQPAPPPAPTPTPTPAPIARTTSAPPRVVSLEVRLQITRSLGQKVISSRPYVIALTVPGGNSQLNLGNEVPIPTTTFTPAGDGKNTPNPLRSYNYRSVGTSIEVTASAVEGEAYDLSVNIDDSSIVTRPDATGADPDLPSMRSYRSRNRVVLKPGESREYTVATDPLSGESIKVTVDLQFPKPQR